MKGEKRLRRNGEWRNRVRKCSVCGAAIDMSLYNAGEYVYQFIGADRLRHWQCSWGCYQRAQAGSGIAVDWKVFFGG